MKMEVLIKEKPIFDNYKEERLYRKQKLAAAFRMFSICGFDEGLAGHITARDPKYKNCFWVNPVGVHFSQIKVSNLSLVKEDGELLEGEPINAAAFAIHSRIHYKTR